MDADRRESIIGGGFLGLFWVFNYQEHYPMGAEIEGFLGPSILQWKDYRGFGGGEGTEEV